MFVVILAEITVVDIAVAARVVTEDPRNGRDL